MRKKLCEALPELMVVTAAIAVPFEIFVFTDLQCSGGQWKSLNERISRHEAWNQV